MVTNLATEAILGTTYICENIEKIGPKSGTLMPVGLSSVAMDESNGAATNTTNVHNGEMSAEEDIEYACVTVRQRKILLLSEAHLNVRTDARGVQLVTTPKNRSRRCRALILQGIAGMVFYSPVLLKAANWITTPIDISKRLNVAPCRAAPNVSMEPPSEGPEIWNKAQVLHDREKATQIYEAPKLKDEVMKRHHVVKKEDAGQADQHWTETV